LAKSLSSMIGIEREIRWATVRGARGAARRALQAAAIGQSGQVLVLGKGTGKPVKTIDLARQLIGLAGHTTEELPFEFTGLRARDRRFEESLANADTTREHLRDRVPEFQPWPAA
jgi:FlaA1/EpsC-like NDP-sugar epimerase